MPFSNINLQTFEFKNSIGVFKKTFLRKWPGGGMSGLVSLKSPKEEDLEKVGGLIVDTLQDLIMNSVEEDRIKLLKNALNELRGQTQKFIEAEGLSDIDLEVGINLFVQETVYVGVMGDVGCFVERNGKVLDIAKHVGDKVFVVSGKLREDDIVLLTTQSGENFRKGIASDIGKLRDSGGIAASYGVAFTNLEEEVIEELNEEASVEIQESDTLLKEEELELDSATTSNDTEESGDHPALDLGADVQSQIENNIEEAGSEEIGIDKEVLDDQEDKVEAEDLKYNVEEKGGALSSSTGLSGKFKVVLEKVSPKIKPAAAALLKYIGSVLNWVLNTIVGTGGSRYKVPGDNSLKKRRLLLLGLIIVFGFVLYFSIRSIKQSNYNREQQAQFDTVLSESQSLLQDAESKLSYNKEESLNLLSQVNQKIEILRGLDVEDSSALDELSQKTREVEDSAQNRVRITSPEVLSDLKIWYENAEPVDLVYYKNSVWVADSANSAIYKIDTEQNSTKQILGRSEGLEEPRYLEVMGDVIYVYDGKKGVLSIDPAEETLAARSVTGLSPTSLGDVAEMASYADALYFLVPGESKILRSGPAGSGFAYPQARLVDESFSNALDLEINGLIYTLGNGELVRFFQDTRDSQIEFEGVESLGNSNKFDLLTSLKAAILDVQNEKVIVLNQPTQGGSSLFKLDMQYVIDDGSDRYFKDLKEIDFDDLTQSMYILDGFRVIRIQIDE